MPLNDVMQFLINQSSHSKEKELLEQCSGYVTNITGLLTLIRNQINRGNLFMTSKQNDFIDVMQ